MFDFPSLDGFEWDKGNTDKSYEKHGITPNQTEEIFLDEKLAVLEDSEHSKQERRLIAIGATFDQSVLFVVFTVRKNKIRIISARKANRKERGVYEQAA